MSTCQRCKSKRVISINAKCSDLCSVNIYLGNGCGKESDGYVPHDMGIGGGDYVEIDLCMDCGQTQGKYPRPISDLEREPLENIKVQDTNIKDLPLLIGSMTFKSSQDLLDKRLRGIK